METGPGQGSLHLAASSSGSEKSRSTSVSPAPEVKIEVDEVPPYQSGGGVEGRGTQQDMEKQPSGKLESRYPALFNQLQQAKQTNTSNVDQSDSLVNRLPFISFQELFAPANPMPNSSKLSEFATKQLLEQAKVNPFPSRVKAKKSIWKWKKRQVKPKDGQELTTADVNDSATPQSLGVSPRKAFARKRQKVDDKEWTPAGARHEETMEDEPDLGNTETEAAPREKITTRLSAGEKPRINFAELENSDLELEEEEEELIVPKTEENSEPPIELVSAYCMYNCGLRFDSFTELKLHEDRCAWNPGARVGEEPSGGADSEAVGAGPEVMEAGSMGGIGLMGGTGPNAGPGVIEAGSLGGIGLMGEAGQNAGGMGPMGGVGPSAVGAGPDAAGTNGEDYKCTVCGLHFNQEYRWHYHMVKVHGVAAEKADLFR